MGMSLRGLKVELDYMRSWVKLASAETTGLIFFGRWEERIVVFMMVTMPTLTLFVLTL